MKDYSAIIVTFNNGDELFDCLESLLKFKNCKEIILVDNGMGNKQSEKFFGFYYLHGNDTLEKSLAQHGFGVDDITDVFLTHLHFDHCGGSIQFNKDKTGYEPVFKNATYWSNQKHSNAGTMKG